MPDYKNDLEMDALESAGGPPAEGPELEEEFVEEEEPVDMMEQEVLVRLSDEAGLSPEQAKQAFDIMKESMGNAAV